MDKVRAEVLSQLDQLIAEGDGLSASYRSSKGKYYSERPESEFRSFVTASRAAIERVAGRDSQYFLSISQCEVTQRISEVGCESLMPALIGSLRALRSAVDAGYLVTIQARLCASIHDDMLVQASELLKCTYHVAAMVLIGGVLENHLRKLATTRGVTWTGSGSIAKYNDGLRSGLYSQAIWRRVQAIADTRNDAAHGNGHSIVAADVTDALQFTSRLIADYPA